MLEIKETTSTLKCASYLDLYIDMTMNTVCDPNCTTNEGNSNFQL